MKKKLFFSGAMLLVALSLVACNTTSSSGTSNVDSENLITSSEDPITSSEEPAATAGWTTEEQAIMSSHLEGYVLPFIELNDDAEVVWYEDWGCVSIESATSPLTKVDEYVAILEAEGIVMTYDSDYELTYGYIDFASGDYIEIQVYSFADNGLNFVCDAYYVPAE